MSKHEFDLAMIAFKQLADTESFENIRGQLDKQRVHQKIAMLINEYRFSQDDIDAKANKVGRLTFEVFLDDLANNNFEASKAGTLDSLYATWELGQIQKFSKKGLAQLQTALETTTKNNHFFKEPAKAQILKLKNDATLSQEEKDQQIQMINDQWIQKAKEVNGMLNRQELVLACLINKSETDLIKAIQIIGKVYHNNPNLKVD